MFCETVGFLLSVVIDNQTMKPVKFEENDKKIEIINPKLIKKVVPNINQEKPLIKKREGGINNENQVLPLDEEYIDYKILLEEQCWENVEEIEKYEMVYELSETFEKMEIIGYDAETKVYYIKYKNPKK